MQISPKTALKYRLIPIENEFYGLSKADLWAALHDPDFRNGGQPSSDAPAVPNGETRDPPRLTPAENLSRHQTPYPSDFYDPHGNRRVHQYLAPPATSFDAGAKLLKIYLQRLVDDYKSGACLNYSAGFRGLIGLSSPKNPIHKDLTVLASGDSEAILNLHASPGLARALAMMWNNGEDIVNVENFNADTPNAYIHGQNMESQQVNQDDLVPAPYDPQP